jgi:MFS transporter, AAHS family, 3-hydroxyphenylpropionic acid transporter
MNRPWIIVVLLWLGGVCAAAQFSKIASVLEPLEKILGVGPPASGALMGATGIAGVFLGLAGAGLVNTLGAQRVLLVSLAAAALLSLIEATMPPYPVFYALRLLEGVTNVFITIAAPTLIARHAPRRHLAIALGLWSTFYGIAFALAATVTPVLAEKDAPQMLFFAHAALCLLILVLLGLTLASETEDRPDWRNTLSAFSPAAHAYALGNLRILLPGVTFLFHAAASLGLMAFLPPLSPSPAIGNTLAVAMPLASIIGTFLSGFLMKLGRVAPDRSIVIGFALALFLTQLLGANLTDHGFFVTGALLAVTSGAVQGLVFILVPHLAQKPHDEALGFGMTVPTGGLANMLGPVVFAPVGAAWGIDGLMWSVGICLAIGGLVAWLGLRRIAASI